MKTVLDACGEQSAAEADLLKQVLEILQPVQGTSWPSGLPENN